MSDRYPFRMTIPQFGFALLCLAALSFLIFYLGARFGPKLFWGLSLDEIGHQASLIPTEVTDEELEAMLKEEGSEPTTFHDTLVENTVMKPIPEHPGKLSPSPPPWFDGLTTSSPARGEGELKAAKKVLPAATKAVPEKPEKKEEIAAVIEKELARYTLKVGSFGQAAEAKALQGKLARAGYTASVKAVKIPEKGEWYRVYLGRYPSQSQAESAGKRLQSATGITPAVVPLSP